MLEAYGYDAGRGDCVRLRFGDTNNVFVDTGTMRFARRLETLCEELSAESLDLLVLTHADDDHIGGILRLLRTGWKCPFAEVRMNRRGSAGSGHAYLSTQQNDEVYDRLVSQGVRVLPMLAGCEFEVGGASIRTLGPKEIAIGSEKSNVPLAYGRDYGKTLDALAKEPIRRKDRSPSNRDSIVFTFAYEGHSILLTGDAWAEDLIESLEDGPHSFDLVKLPHHGSTGNISEGFPQAIRCSDFLVCADGTLHPDKQTIAKLIAWYGSINIYSPSNWWSRGFFVDGDDTEGVSLACRDGLMMSWR